MTSRPSRLAVSLVALLAILAIGAYGSVAAFTDTTVNSGNSFATGTIDIADDSSGSTMFQVTGMLPGSSQTRCINVTNAGTSTFADVSLYGTIGGTGLATSLTVDVDRGTGATGGSSFSCTGFSQSTADIVTGALSAFPTSGAPVTDGTGWTASATKSYRITIALPSNASESAEGLTATASITWQASS